MNKFSFTEFLSSNIQISNELLEELMASSKKISLKKDAFLLRQGERCSLSFYVEKGLLRQYSIDERGKEHVLQFAPEGWFISVRESVFLQQPSAYFVQALEDAEVLGVEETFFSEVASSNEKFFDFNTRLLHNHIWSLQSRITMLQSASAEERYLHFVQMYPDILLRVPQWMVASYLGIAPESLSRVRKALAGKSSQPTS